MTRDEIEQYVARRNRVLERIGRVLVESLGVRREPQEIDADAPLFGTGLGLDSIDAVELIVSLEAAFGLRFPQTGVGLGAMRTVGSLADAVLALEDAHG